MRLSLIARSRSRGLIVPTGIATDDTTKYFFGDLVRRGRWSRLYSFENEEFVFPSVHHAYRFCLMTMAGTSSRHETVDLVFYARQVSWLDDPDRHFSLTPEEFALLNPNTGTCPTFRSKLDAEIAKDVYRRIPVLIDHGDPAGNPWGITFLRMFDMANDSHLFRDNPGVDRSPLYEAKLLHQYTHRWSTYDGPEARDMSLEELQDPTRSTNPRYWVDQGEVEARLQDRWTRGWLLAFRNIVRAHDARTVIATAIPRVAVAHSAPVLLAGHSYFPLLIANLNSFAFDWQARQKVGGINLTFGLFEQLPVLPPAIYASPTPWSRESLADWLRRYVAELAFTAWDLRPYAQDLGWTGHPYSWDVERRAQLRAELDAAFFHLYGLSRDHAEHIMESFHVVREREQKANGHFRTKDLVLGAYDAMSEATQDRPFVSVLRPAPGDPSVDHAQSVGETAGSWVPWTEPAL